MITQNDVPQAVILKATDLIELYGANFVYAGKYKEGLDAYLFQFPENTETGYPFLYLYNSQSESTTVLTGFEAMEILQNIKG